MKYLLHKCFDANFISLSVLAENFTIHDSELFHIISQGKYLILKYVGVRTYRSKIQSGSDLCYPSNDKDHPLGWSLSFRKEGIRTK